MKIGIVGNPNSGKTTLFNSLTGGKQRVGNWPGVTVEMKSGDYDHKGRSVDVVDLPGIYSLSASSLDEQISRDYILNDRPDLIVNILDAANLERNLYLTVQLLEMKIPIIIVLNMMDMLKQKSMKIKTEKLAEMLDCPVVCTIAKNGEGVEGLKDSIDRALNVKYISPDNIYFPKEIEAAIDSITEDLQSSDSEISYDHRWAATKLLEGDIDLDTIEIPDDLNNSITVSNKKIEEILGEETDIIIADSRYGFINSICKEVVNRGNVVKKNITDIIDGVALNRFFGIPVFLGAMYITFWLTINLGGCFIDFFNKLFGTVFVDGFGFLLQRMGTPLFLKTLLADGVGGGIQTVSTFIPQIFLMFFCLALLEDSGYMARAAFVMDRMMRAVGLPGKAFVPLLVGFGCNVPAIMATRTLDNEKDRALTIMMNPFMSCGARMPVYALFAAAFFPGSGGSVVFALYIIGIILAVLTAFLLKKTILKGKISTFIMELPPYHIPSFKGILIHTWERLKAFLLRAGKAIILVIIVLSFLNSIGTDGSFGNEDSEKSVLTHIGKKMVPLFKPMGMRTENWPAAVGIFTGIFAKEAIIGTLDILYTQMDSSELKEAEGKDDSFDLKGGIKEAFATIPANLSELTLPFSFTGLIGADVDSAIEGLEVEDSTYSKMRNRFDGKAGAFAYLLMILLYMPCVAAIAAVYRELNLGWTIFSAVYLSSLAWLISTLFYQITRFDKHPLTSIAWIGIVISVLTVFVLAMRKRGALLPDIQ